MSKRISVLIVVLCITMLTVVNLTSGQFPMSPQAAMEQGKEMMSNPAEGAAKMQQMAQMGQSMMGSMGSQMGG